MAYPKGGIRKDGAQAAKAGRKPVEHSQKKKSFHGMATMEDLETIGIENVPTEASRLVKELASKLRKQHRKIKT